MQEIENLLKKAVIEKATPGFALTNISENEHSFTYFGSIDDRQLVTSSETLYDLASLTKVVATTSRLLQLVDEKKITFATKISEIFPDCQNLQMTVKQVMLHQAGFLPDFADKSHFSREMLWKYFSDFSYEENNPTAYSDLGFLLLGELVEKLDHKNLEESYQEHIFIPLKMLHTTYFPRNKFYCAPTELSAERGRIQAVVHDGKAFRFGKPAGHAGLFSSVEDIEKFLQAFLKRQIFSEKITEKLLTENVNGRSYGWAVYEKKGQLYHTGFTGGLICIDLLRNRALGLLSNSTFPSRSDKRFVTTRHEICRLFFKED